MRSVRLTTSSPVPCGLDVTRPTAQAAIDALVERGDLIEVTGREGGRVYEAPRIFTAVYGDVDLPEDEDPQQRFDLAR